MQQRNEIITFGKGYDLIPGIKVFVKSAKKVCSNLTVICSNLSNPLMEFLKEYNVKIVDADEIAKKFNVQTSLSPYTLKVIYFYLYIKNYCCSTNVYLCDFTDIYFQRDPFALIKSNDAYVTSENHLIRDCQTNSTWIYTCYNPDVYSLLNHHEILNGGNIMGNKNSCMELLKEVCADMSHIISRIGNYPNIDQASLIKTVYFDRHKYNILRNHEILNMMAHFKNAKVNYNELITIDNKTPHVIHQYDAIKQLENYLYANN